MSSLRSAAWRKSADLVTAFVGSTVKCARAPYRLPVLGLAVLVVVASSLAVVTWIAARAGERFGAAVAGAIGVTLVFAYLGATDPNSDGLWPIGAVIAFVFSFAGIAVVAPLFARRKAVEVERPSEPPAEAVEPSERGSGDDDSLSRAVNGLGAACLSAAAVGSSWESFQHSGIRSLEFT